MIPLLLYDALCYAETAEKKTIKKSDIYSAGLQA